MTTMNKSTPQVRKKGAPPIQGPRFGKIVDFSDGHKSTSVIVECLQNARRAINIDVL